jgi:hypothetical protein
VNLADNLIIIKLISFVTKPLNLGAYLFVMKKNIFGPPFQCYLFIHQCKKLGDPEVDPNEIQKNFMDWWSYQYNEIMLSRDFVALDSNSKEISKETFQKS